MHPSLGAAYCLVQNLFVEATVILERRELSRAFGGTAAHCAASQSGEEKRRGHGRHSQLVSGRSQGLPLNLRACDPIFVYKTISSFGARNSQEEKRATCASHI